MAKIHFESTTFGNARIILTLPIILRLSPREIRVTFEKCNVLLFEIGKPSIGQRKNSTLVFFHLREQGQRFKA